MVKAQHAEMMPLGWGETLRWKVNRLHEAIWHLKLELDAKPAGRKCVNIYIYIYMLNSYENNFIKFSQLNSNSEKWIVQNTV